MGNTNATPEQEPDATGSNQHPGTEDDVSQFEWPSDFYVEVSDMMAASFLVYSFAYILDTARKLGGLEGLAIETTNDRTIGWKKGQIHKSNVSSSQLGRSFTPAEVLRLVQDNAEALSNAFPGEFRDSTAVLESLTQLQERVKEQIATSKTRIERPLSLEEFDDKHQNHELVYAVSKDDINKRITLVFRGSDNELAFRNNWG